VGLPPIVTVENKGMVNEGPAFTIGNGKADTTTVLVSIQVVTVETTCKTYELVLVTNGIVKSELVETGLIKSGNRNQL
jgi:hypothetical protein